MQAVTVLGATGSIGCSTLDVLARHPDRFSVFALTAHRDVDGLFQQIQQYRPRYAVMVDATAAEALAERLAASNSGCELLVGAEALLEVAAATEVDTVMAAIVGAAGLPPTLAAVKQGKRVLLANKESLVMAGDLFMRAVAEHGAELLPIDSEHNAIFQCLPKPECGVAADGVSKLLLTASGGPFRETALAELPLKTPDQAVAHPNWDMGRKISVDSATMMNKGLELIEARWLFALPASAIDVVIHPQSIIHSLVQYVDGSVLAQLGNPDMRTPIAHALGLPVRLEAGVEPLDLFAVGQLNFERPDMRRYPCLQLAYDALAAGGVAPAVLNAANEVSVQAFLDEQIGYTDIAAVNGKVLNQFAQQNDWLREHDWEALHSADHEARRLAALQVGQQS